MGDATSNTSTTTEPGGSTPPATTPPATPPATPTEVDLSKLEGDQLAQVLENPNLWKNPRLAGLLESDKQLKKLKADQDKQTEDQLAENKKWEELANKRGTESEQKDTRIQELVTNQALTNLLVPANVVDLDGALKLIDRSNISVDENGTVTGVDEAIESLKKDKAYLFTTDGGTPRVGSPSNPSSPSPGTGGQYKFKESQMTPAFFNENKVEIMEAYRNGQIEADGPPQ